MTLLDCMEHKEVKKKVFVETDMILSGNQSLYNHPPPQRKT